MEYYPEILGLLILACSVNLLPTATEEDRDLNITGMKTRHVRRSEIDARSSIKFPNNNILPISFGHFVRAPAGNWSNQGSRATNEGADPFVFPDDSGVVERFIPKFGKRTPDCANGTTFCENVENYPSKYLENILEDNGKQFNALFGNDITDPNINHRIDYDETSLCLSVEQVVYPKTAKNKDDQWLYVVNQGQYRQGIRIEKCVAPTNPPQSCSFTEGFPIGYKTECRQKHIYRRLLALNEDGKTITDSFQLPSCCACIVVHDSALRSRVGSISKKESQTHQNNVTKIN